jgi:hypothetical protein
MEVTLLNEVIDQATDALQIAPDQMAKRELMAQLIVQAAIDDEKLDAEDCAERRSPRFENRRKDRRPDGRGSLSMGWH